MPSGSEDTSGALGTGLSVSFGPPPVTATYSAKKSAKKAGKALGVLVVSTAVSAAVPAVLAALADPATVAAVIGEGNWLWAVPVVNMAATAALDWWKHRD